MVYINATWSAGDTEFHGEPTVRKVGEVGDKLQYAAGLLELQSWDTLARIVIAKRGKTGVTT